MTVAIGAIGKHFAGIVGQTRMRYGYFRIHILLRREGWAVNHKRVYRLYRMA